MKRTFSQWITTVLTNIIILSLFACSSFASDSTSVPALEAPKPYEIGIGASTTGGQMYRFVLALCNAINSHSDFLTASAIPTTGSNENINLTSIYETDLSACGSYALYHATQGLRNWEGAPIDNLRYVSAMYRGYAYFVTTSDSPINSASDLRGVRLSLEQFNNSGGPIDLINALGIDEKTDIEAVYLSTSETCSAISEGAVDAFVEVGGSMLSAIAQMQTSRKGLKVIGLTDEEVETVCKKLPYYKPIIMEKSYPGIPPVNTVGNGIALVANDKVPDYVVYEVCRIINEYRDELVMAVSDAVDSTPENSVEYNFIEWAPGAEQYYKKIGVLN
jgi:TRAP transporter TAXI family solute receptor